MQARVKELIDQIDNSIDLTQEKWEIWSGEFNRHLRKLIEIDPKEQVLKYKFVFGYWQIQNTMFRLDASRSDEIEDLVEQANILKAEALK